jgi:hypothetical protein
MKMALYGLTALIIGMHSFYWLMSAIYGGPINPWYGCPSFWFCIADAGSDYATFPTA